MAKPFDEITLKNKEKLIRLLRGYSVKYDKNKEIIDEFNDNDDLGIIISGKLDIIRNNYDGSKTLIEELNQDDLLSKSLVYINDECSIVAKEDTEILLFSYNSLIKQSINNYSYNQLLKNLFIILKEDIAFRNERIEILTKRSIRDKLLEYFNISSNRSGSRIITLPFNFSDLANYLAIDRSAMSRELGYLKDEKIISVKGKKITLLYK